jgi:hypothetical protein
MMILIITESIQEVSSAEIFRKKTNYTAVSRKVGLWKVNESYPFSKGSKNILICLLGIFILD